VSQDDFKKMTQSELRAYVIAHPNDQNAFYAFLDRFTSVCHSLSLMLKRLKS